MKKYWIISIIIILITVWMGYWIYSTQVNEGGRKFKFGLDLSGGSHLTYRADASGIDPGDVNSAMDSLRMVIERRINIFGVSEPIVQVEKGGTFASAEDQNRLIVELPEITDLDQAIKMIGETPLLEFKLETQDEAIISKISALTATSSPEAIASAIKDAYIPTGLTGAELERATLVFEPNTGNPAISLKFNSNGTGLLKEITTKNIGRVMAIFLDGEAITAPVIQSEILNGEAQITGTFSNEEAKSLVQNLNFGALPLPIELIETQTIGATLGTKILGDGLIAFVWALLIISVFMILWYRLPGFIAVISLAVYIIILLAIFKGLPVVLTASGIAGFILSLGMAVDANVLIFERMKEELKDGATTHDAVNNGVNRAWTSIRDGNYTSLISAIVLYWLSGTAVVKGFALVFGIGIIVSMFTAVVVSRYLLLMLSSNEKGKVRNFLFNCGFNK